MAPSSSGLGTRSGVIDSQAGALSAQPALSTKVVARSATGVASFSETSNAKAAIKTAMPSEMKIRRRRASMMSASAPAGSVKRNIGKLPATCTRETMNGSALRLVISQPEAVSFIAMPIRAIV